LKEGQENIEKRREGTKKREPRFELQEKKEGHSA